MRKRLVLSASEVVLYVCKIASIICPFVFLFVCLFFSYRIQGLLCEPTYFVDVNSAKDLKK